MTMTWIPLPASWSLEDVQAALNVVISMLSSVGIFVLARVCWLLPATRVAKDRNVTLYSLLSVNTLGEAYDILMLLRTTIFSARYSKILIQCVVIIFLSATAIFSGPIARFSTRRGHLISRINVNGSLVTDYHSGIGYANVEWNQIQTSLDRAEFPLDQLLDFLPDVATDWVYRPEEWNSTWTMTCNETAFTPLSLYVTGNCTTSTSEIPGLAEVMPGDYDYYYQTWDGLYVNFTRQKDILMFIVGENFYDQNENTGRAYKMGVSLASVHLHNLTRNSDENSICDFGPGPVHSASYTKFSCDLSRPFQIPDEYCVAYPDTEGVSSIPSAFTEYFQARFTQESASDSPITVITPKDLIRFYQVYIVSKDTQYRQPVTRKLSVELPNVELSPAFLAIAILVSLLVAAGLTKYGFFIFLYHNTLLQTPDSKLDWMLQSISDERTAPTSLPNIHDLRRSATVSTHEDFYGLSVQEKKRAEFISATYGSSNHGPWMSGYPGGGREGAAGWNHGPATMIRSSSSMAVPHHRPKMMEMESMKSVSAASMDKAPMLSINFPNEPLTMGHEEHTAEWRTE